MRPLPNRQPMIHRTPPAAVGALFVGSAGVTAAVQGHVELLTIRLAAGLADREVREVGGVAGKRRRERVVDGAASAGRERRALAILRGIEVRRRRRAAEDID